ncbi:transposase domain containing protein [Trichonephila clavipes]|nr:transposase domain containing protein [Trichonephila clavipes]
MAYVFPAGNGMFQLDNAPCQKSKIALEWFQVHDAELQLMSWPPNSSDINPMEYIWDVMGRQLRVQRPPIHNISDLCDRCLNIWYNLSPAIYHGLVASMPRWVEAVLYAKDGATCHTARATIDLLKDTFDDRLISRFGPVNWPPRSCDLTPLDYFLWGYVRSLVYADKPQMLDHLEDNIRRVIADIRPQMLEKVIENWTSRLDYIRASRRSHMPEIIFKM